MTVRELIIQLMGEDLDLPVLVEIGKGERMGIDGIAFGGYGKYVPLALDRTPLP